MATKNREQRRAEEHGRPDPTAVRSPFSADDLPANDAVAGQPGQDRTDLTGPGTGGATETADRKPHHEGAHIGGTPKG
jgi:hypothetical protein